jgi:hypothetical protein
MTDRINVLTVTLTHDIREDDIEPLVNAIGQLRGVLRVDKHVANSLDALAAEARLKEKLFKEITAIFYLPPPKEPA